jgi:hypothetical protein
MVASLKSEFQATNDGSFAWESMVSALLSMPGLRATWPLSIVGASGQAQELCNALHLTNVNTVEFTAYQNSKPCAIFTSANSERLWRADAADFDIIGSEAYVPTAQRGLTLGAWVNRTTVGAAQTVLAKWNTAGNQRSYILQSDTDGAPIFTVSGNGTAELTINHSTACAADEWHFIAGRFRPAGTPDIDVWRNLVYETNSTSIPATLFNSSSDFEIGSNDSGANYLNGKVALAFLCVMALPDAAIKRFYYRTRPLYQSRSAW